MTEIRILEPGEPPGVESKAITGTPDHIASVLRQFAEAGVDHVVLFIEPTGVTGLKRLQRMLASMGNRCVS